MYRYVYYTELGFRNFGHTWVLLWRIELQTLLSHQVVELQTGLAELSEKASGDKCGMDDEGLVGVTLVFGLPLKSVSPASIWFTIITTITAADMPELEYFDHNHGKSPFSMGKSTINGHFQ